MTGKKVRVFWPVDSQWYIADVQQYDIRSGEHLLRYPDGDTEWVRIGEDHTTNHTQYKEYYYNQSRNPPPPPHSTNPPPPHPHHQYHASTTTTTTTIAKANNSASANVDDDNYNNSNSNSNLTRLPSLGNGGGGMSFALSSNMSQGSFGLHSVAVDGNDDEEDDVVLGGKETTMQLKTSSSSQQQHQQQEHHHNHHHHRLYQQLNLDRTASSMSSFGMFGVGGGGGEIGTRQPSFASQHPPPPLPPPPHGGGDGDSGVRGATNNYQILSPNFTHSFSSKIGTVPSMDFFPPPPPPPHTHHPHRHTGGRGDPYAPPHPPPHHHNNNHHHHQQQQQQQQQHHRHQQQQREGEGERVNNIWSPNHPYPNETYYDERGHHPIIYSHQGVQQQYQLPIPKPGHDSNTTTTSATSSTGQPSKRRPPSELSPSKSSNKNDIKTIERGVSTTTTSNPGGLSAKTRKALPTAWAPAEDEHLLDLVLQMQHPLKWSVIAESLSSMMANNDCRLPPRTGKQCRERVSTHIYSLLNGMNVLPSHVSQPP